MATYLFFEGFFLSKKSERFFFSLLRLSSLFSASSLSLSIFRFPNKKPHSHRRHVERLEHDLRHFLAVGLGVERRLGQQDRVLLGGDAELVVEGVVPDLLLLLCDGFFWLVALLGEKERRARRG